MRLYVLIFAVAICFFCLAEAGKKERRRKKITEQLAQLDLEENLNRGKHDDEITSTDSDDEAKMEIHYGPRYKKKYKKNKHGKKGKFDHKNQMAWLNVKTGSECEIECKHKEVCIVGPIDSKPICVNKKDLKKSLKLFYRFQKKEMKAWKEFKKEKYNHEANNRYPFDIEENGQDLNVDNKNLQVVKQNNSNQLKEESQVQKYGPSKSEADPEGTVCTTAQFSQMRTRMMGWFHLLHGQDHDARKASGKSIKHFYKHFSVKKELRQYDGFKCECLKSAIWQFLQMDKNGDDSLSDTEMSMLEENSLEPCMRPYLTSCDQNADQKLSSDEWCCCFSNVVAPCFKKVDDVRKSGEPVAYMPRCDKEGYYLREQCEGEKDKEFKCWCVDYNGNELGGTRTNGRAHCSKIAMNGSQKGKA